MKGITHLLVAVVFALFFAPFFSFFSYLIFFSIFLFAALLPDIDHPGSMLGKKLWPLSSVLSLFFGHRGLLHSIFIPLAFLFLGWYFQFFWIGIALAGGYLSHLVADSLTVSGVKPFGIGPRIRGFVRTGGLLESLFFFLLLVFLLWLFWLHF